MSQYRNESTTVSMVVKYVHRAQGVGVRFDYGPFEAT